MSTEEKTAQQKVLEAARKAAHPAARDLDANARKKLAKAARKAGHPAYQNRVQ